MQEFFDTPERLAGADLGSNVQAREGGADPGAPGSASSVKQHMAAIVSRIEKKQEAREKEGARTDPAERSAPIVSGRLGEADEKFDSSKTSPVTINCTSEISEQQVLSLWRRGQLCNWWVQRSGGSLPYFFSTKAHERFEVDNIRLAHGRYRIGVGPEPFGMWAEFLVNGALAVEHRFGYRERSKHACVRAEERLSAFREEQRRKPRPGENRYFPRWLSVLATALLAVFFAGGAGTELAVMGALGVWQPDWVFWSAAALVGLSALFARWAFYNPPLLAWNRARRRLRGLSDRYVAVSENPFAPASRDYVRRNDSGVIAQARQERAEQRKHLLVLSAAERLERTAPAVSKLVAATELHRLRRQVSDLEAEAEAMQVREEARTRMVEQLQTLRQRLAELEKRSVGLSQGGYS